MVNNTVDNRTRPVTFTTYTACDMRIWSTSVRDKNMSYFFHVSAGTKWRTEVADRRSTTLLTMFLQVKLFVVIYCQKPNNRFHFNSLLDSVLI